jgi:hypothetical protein
MSPADPANAPYQHKIAAKALQIVRSLLAAPEQCGLRIERAKQFPHGTAYIAHSIFRTE